MPTQDDHAHKLETLLPVGSPWIGADILAMCRALAGDPSRVDQAGYDLLQDFMPDTVDVTGRFIPDWARLLGLPEACEANAWATMTDTEKKQRILAKLNFHGLVNLPNLDTQAETMLGNPLVELYHLLTPSFVVGAGAVGNPLYGPQWDATWILEYMPDVLEGEPDDFESWTGSNATVNNGEHSSPATLAVTAAEVEFTGVGSIVQNLDLSVAIDHTVRFIFWIKAITPDPIEEITVVFRKRDGPLSFSTPEVFQITSTWTRIVYEAPIGVGATQPLAAIQGEDCTFAISWALAGSKDEAFECKFDHLPPINTTGIYEIIGALFGGLAGQDLVDDLDDELLIDDEDDEQLIDE